MKAKLKEQLSEIPNDFLLEIIDTLCQKNKQLENEIEFILSYYNRLVKTAIDTNSWSHFPNKGVVGLRLCLDKMRLFQSAGNYLEARKLSLAISGIIDRCRRRYNNQNEEALDDIEGELVF